MIPKTETSWRQRYLQSLSLNEKTLSYWSLKNLAEDFRCPLGELPFVTRLFLENVMRHYEGNDVTPAVITHLFSAAAGRPDGSEPAFSFYPSRVLMQDYTGVPAIADLAAMRDAVAERGGNPKRINPVCPVDLVIDHSVIVDQAGTDSALFHNRAQEMARNQERYQFLKWAQQSFDNLTIVPPGRGICHQVNLEYFAQVTRNVENTLIPDTLVGTDSHTTMINGLGVLGWGVGGIEAEAVMLGQPLSLNMPNIVGVKLEGKLPAGTTATDLVLAITERLRNHGVVGKFVEFYGSGMLRLSVADRATIANMAPEYGATCGLFPIDEKVIDYLTLTNRPVHIVEQVRAYAIAQRLWYGSATPDPDYSEKLCIQLADIEPSVAGPKRPQDRLSLPSIKTKTLEAIALAGHIPPVSHASVSHASVSQKAVADQQPITDGDIVIAAITSCTNTSNPHVMLLAGLLAKAAVEKGLSVKPHVKTSLAPGSQVVARYLDSLGLQPYLNQLGFQRVGFGCTTCIGNSGPLNPGVEAVVEQGQLNVCAVLSGNRNFEGRVHPAVRLNWLASPPLVIAYALVGHTRIDLVSEPLGYDEKGSAVFLKDIWPSDSVVNKALQQVTQAQYAQSYENMLLGDEAWESLPVEETVRYHWNKQSTYIRKPPFFAGMPNVDSDETVDRKYKPIAIQAAKILAILGDSITTDHISPAGQINENSPAGSYLLAHRIKPDHFNSYGSRRGNHEVMVRGTFANKRLKNKMVSPKEGGFTLIDGGNGFQEDGQAHQILPIYEASQHHIKKNNPLVVFAGKEYGTGSSRDWAAKGCLLLNVKAVIAESYERIHRSNLVGMGILPLQLPSGTRVDDLCLAGDETIDIQWSDELRPGQSVDMLIRRKNGEHKAVTVIVRVENNRELDYFYAGGVLRYVADQFSQKKGVELT